MTIRMTGWAVILAIFAGAATRAADDALLTGVVRDLGNSDFARREAAQKRLREMPLDFHDTLSDLAQRETDPEVRQRLLLRVEEIEEIWATDPPPISLHINHLNDREMVEALGKSLGVPLSLQQQQTDAFYTLDLDKKPFWDVYRALMLQHPVMLHTSYWSNDLLARIARRGDAVQIERHGGITVIAAAAPYEEPNSTSSSHKPQPPVPADSRKISVMLAYVTDPRIDVLKYWTPLIGSVSDEKGKVLHDREAGKDVMTPSAAEKFWRDQIELVVPRANGPRTMTVKGEVRMLVGVRSARYEFDDLSARVGNEIHVGEERYAVQKFTVAERPRPGGWYDVVLELAPRNAKELLPLHYEVFDGNGRRLINDTSEGVMLGMGVTSSQKPEGPFKLVITRAEKTKDWQIPFELKGIVVP